MMASHLGILVAERRSHRLHDRRTQPLRLRVRHAHRITSNAAKSVSLSSWTRNRRGLVRPLLPFPVPGTPLARAWLSLRPISSETVCRRLENRNDACRQKCVSVAGSNLTCVLYPLSFILYPFQNETCISDRLDVAYLPCVLCPDGCAGRTLCGTVRGR